LSYQILFKRSAAKTLKKITKADQKRIANKINSLADNPFHRVRVSDYRIIYEIQDDVLIIIVAKIGHRKDIYRNIL
jgi:mRNA interferase RelE/StbE